MESRAGHRTLGVGEMLNWYRIERVLGRGGFGVIYLATDTNLDHPVAIKEYLPPGAARRAGDTAVEPLTDRHGDLYRWGLDRFIKEARNLVRFKHPNIVRVMSVFQQNNTAYMVMEFEAGEILPRHLERANAVTEARLRALADPLLDGLDEVHRHGFIHRDVKPANVLVRPDGSPVLLDFGSARNAMRGAGEAMTALVSAGYAPLEQYDDGDDEQQGPWTDIYALGGVLYYAISGADPVDSARRGAALVNGARDPLIPATVLGAGRFSRGFLAAIDWALEHRIADRPQTLADWRPALLGDAVAVDAEARRRALAAVPPGPATARRARRFEDPDDFGGTHRTGRPEPGRPTGPARQDTGRPATAGSGAGRSPTGRHDTRHPTRTRRGATGRVRTARPHARAESSGARISRARAVIATSVLVGGVGVLWFASEQSSDAAEAARRRAAAEARALIERSIEEGADGGVGEATRTVVPHPDAIAATEAELDEREPDEGGDGERAVARREAAREAAALEAAREAERAASLEAEREAEREAQATERRRRAAAERRERALAERHEGALDDAAVALRAGRLADASAALDEARRTGRPDARVAALAADLQAARDERARPVSDEEFERVVRRFDGLKRAIESKDLAVIEALTVPSDQNALFAQLMDGFESLNMEITGIRVRNADKSVTANLRIRDMHRANGDSAEPSPAYRDRDITSRLVEGRWSDILW